jgi:hypothetical protein
VLGGETIYAGGPSSGEPSFVKLADSWIIINVGGGPTDDKPTVILETPPDPDRTSSILNIRVADIASVYAEWTSRGAGVPDRAEAAHTRDSLLHARPDGHLIEVGQVTDPLIRD